MPPTRPRSSDDPVLTIILDTVMQLSSDMGEVKGAVLTLPGLVERVSALELEVDRHAKYIEGSQGRSASRLGFVRDGVAAALGGGFLMAFQTAKDHFGWR